MSDLRRRASQGSPHDRSRSRNVFAHGRSSYENHDRGHYDCSRYDRSRYGSGRRRNASSASSHPYEDSGFSSVSAGTRRGGSHGRMGRDSSGYQQGYGASRQARYGQRSSEEVGRRSHSSRSSRDSRDAFTRRGQRASSAPVDDSASHYSREATLAKRRRRRPRKALIAVVSVAVAALLCGGFAFAYVNDISTNLNKGVDQNLRNALVQTDMANEPFYMLLLGTDGSRERDASGELDGVYRSDTMMLARIDAPQKKATLVSIGRDTTVDLGEHGQQKINAAYGLGGPALAVKAVSELAGVPISHYAQVDFNGFADLIDAMGGVEVDVPMELNDADAGGHVDAGLQTLDGDKALILCRARNSYADLAAHPDEMRAANQRLVLAAIAKKILDSDVVTIAGSAQTLSRFVSTDLGLTDIIGLAQALQGLDPSTDIYTAQAPTNSRYEGDVWYEYIDTARWKAMMERVDQGEAPTEESLVDETTGTLLASAGKAYNFSSGTKNSSVTVKNGTQRQGLAADTREALMASGFTDVVVGDIAEGYRYPNTLIIYEDSGQVYEAEQIAELLGCGRALQNDGSYLLSGTDFLVVIGEDWPADSKD